jgi:outer membrane protein assembly factor BamB
MQLNKEPPEMMTYAPLNRCGSMLVLFGALWSSSCGWRETPVTTTVYSKERSGVTIDVDDSDVPSWRGLAGDGRFAAASVTHWSPSENVLWKAAVPGRGHSTPVLCGEHVLLTTSDDAASRQLLLAYDRKSGERLWESLIHEGNLPRRHNKNSHASASPACDGQHVYCVFINGDQLWVTAVDMQGQQAWQTAVGEFTSEHGYGSSPVLYQSLIIVNGDNLSNSFVAAIDRGTGKVVWSTTRRTSGRHGSYATPVVAHLGGRDQLLLSGSHSTSSYHPDTGALLWTCEGPAEVTACTPAFSEDLVFSSGGYPEKELLAIRPDGSGDVSASHIAWRTSKGVTYVPSPLYHDGLLYVVNDGGFATCFDAKTGGQVWQERLDGSFSASPVLAGDAVLVTNEAGTTYVFRAGRTFELIATNKLESGGFASPVVSSGRIYLRTDNALYCVGAKNET